MIIVRLRCNEKVICACKCVTLVLNYIKALCQHYNMLLAESTLTFTIKSISDPEKVNVLVK